MQKENRVVVDRQQFFEEVVVLLREVAAAIEGDRWETREIREKMCAFVEGARLCGEKKVCEILVFDLVGVPLLLQGDGEPVWYLTLSLNADVPGRGK